MSLFLNNPEISKFIVLKMHHLTFYLYEKNNLYRVEVYFSHPKLFCGIFKGSLCVLWKLIKTI